MRSLLIAAVIAAMAVCASAALGDDRAPGTPGAGVISAQGSGPYLALLRSDTGEMTAQNYMNVMGLAVVEGDLVLGTHADVQMQTLRNLRDIARGLDRNAIGGDAKTLDQLLKDFDPIADRSGLSVLSLSVGNLWPNKRVPYDIDPAISMTEQDEVAEAARIWNKLGVVTFVRATTALPDNAILHIISAGAEAHQVCLTTTPGHNAQNTMRLSNDCTLYQVVHELGHALGLRHEHSRSDRGTDLAVDLSKIGTSHQSNFKIVPGSFNGTAYDPCSVMHYASVVPGTWTTTGGDETWFTLTAKGKQAFKACSRALPATAGCRTVGQRCALSPSDKAGVATLYH